MKITRTFALFAIAVTASLFWQVDAEAQLKIDCKSVAERVKTAIEAKPEQVLTVVEDALVAYSGCVDVIVKTAIETTKADAEGVKQIVMVAVTTAEKDAPQIAESAVAAAPDHADAVREAFAEAFEKKSKTGESTKPLVEATSSEPKAEPKTAVSKAKPAIESEAQVGGELVKIAKVPDRDSIETHDGHNHSTRADGSHPVDTAAGKAVVGEVNLGGKSVAYESGKEVITEGGKTVVYEDGTNYLDGGKSVTYDGKAVAYEGGGGYVAPASKRGGSSISYGPVDLAGVYFLPPTATAAPIVEKEIETRIRFKNRTRIRRVTRSIPMSPTSP